MLITLKQLFSIVRSIKSLAEYEYLYLVTCGVMIGLLSFNINTMFSVKDHDQTLWILLGLAGGICGAYNKLNEPETEAAHDELPTEGGIIEKAF